MSWDVVLHTYAFRRAPMIQVIRWLRAASSQLRARRFRLAAHGSLWWLIARTSPLAARSWRRAEQPRGAVATARQMASCVIGSVSTLVPSGASASFTALAIAAGAPR